MEETTSTTPAIDYTAYNATLAKLLGKLKKDLGAKRVRQGYHGTGSQAYSRQMWVRLADDRPVDIWLEWGYVQFGGVIRIALAEESNRVIRYAGCSPAEMYAEILRVLKGAPTPAPAAQ
jgi:hypothetical protein